MTDNPIPKIPPTGKLPANVQEQIASLDRRLSALHDRYYVDNPAEHVEDLDRKIDRFLSRIISLEQYRAAYERALKALVSRVDKLERFKQGEPDMPPPDDTPLIELELSARAYNCLYNAGLLTAGAIRATSHVDLIALPNCGKLTFHEILTAIGADQAEYRRPEGRKYP